MTASTRIGWIKSRECGRLLNRRKLILKIKEQMYRSCEKSAKLYGSEAWCRCLGENEIAILRRTEKAII